jgi:hypothetical protein
VTAERPLIDETTAAFVQGGQSILAASSDENNGPVIVRCLGCRVSSKGRLLTVLVPASDPFVLVVRLTKRIAVVFTQPSTHRTIQLKGTDARTLPLRKADLELAGRYADAFGAEVCPLGYTEEAMRALLSCDPPELTPVTFSPTAGFLQTPGPRAGAPLNA